MRDEQRIRALCDRVRQTAFELHGYLRNGHLEKVYENGMAHRLRKIGLAVEQQQPLQVRGLAHVLASFFELLDQTHALRIIEIDTERFGRTRQYFLKHVDQAYSFSDCSSFVVMEEYRLRDALTYDRHFEQAVFNAVLK